MTRHLGTKEGKRSWVEVDAIKVIIQNLRQEWQENTSEISKQVRMNSIWFPHSLWRRANARSVSFETLPLTLSTQLIIRNYTVILSHRRSTTVSLETYPLNWSDFTLRRYWGCLRILFGIILLCAWVGQSPLSVHGPSRPQEYIWVPANCQERLKKLGDQKWRGVTCDKLASKGAGEGE